MNDTIGVDESDPKLAEGLKVSTIDWVRLEEVDLETLTLGE